MLVSASLVCSVLAADDLPAKSAPQEKVPGVIIAHSAASSGQFIGSPSLVILPDGNYLASHDFFGPKSGQADCGVTEIFCSTNRGASWRKTAGLRCGFWANLFAHRGAVYLLGTTKEYGQIVIRRSVDDGQTWTAPDSPATGQLTPTGHWHTAPVPVVEHAGRVWRAFENADHGTEWGRRFCAGLLSAPADADLLNATNWTRSNFLPGDARWQGGDFGGWLEGNAVVAQDGTIVDVLRVDTLRLPEKAALVTVSADGRTASFDPASGFLDLPGGAKKFTIRPDPHGGGYWTLASIVGTGRERSPSGRPGGIRNTLALLHSADLRRWEIRAGLLHHADPQRHGFQ